MSKDISREKDKLRLLWKEKRKKLVVTLENYKFISDGGNNNSGSGGTAKKAKAQDDLGF